MKSIKINRALISVSNKDGLGNLAKNLVKNNIEIISTGGTKNFLKRMDIDVIDVSSVTGFPEILDGRVKTLHPNIHGGLLGIKGNKKHENTLKENSIEPIDLLVVNLYPFEETIQKGANFAECIENIDIGGPAMIRAAAKNHESVAVIVDPNDYDLIIKELNNNKGNISEKILRKLALTAYSRTAAYDSNISNWLKQELDSGNQSYKALGLSLIHI